MESHRSTASKRRRGEESPNDLDKGRKKKKRKSSDKVHYSKSKHGVKSGRSQKRHHTSGKHKKKHTTQRKHRKVTYSSSSDSSDTDSDSTESSSDSTSSSDSEEAGSRVKHKRHKKGLHAKGIKKKSRHKPHKVSHRAALSAVKPSSCKVAVSKEDTTPQTQSERV